MEVRVDSNLIRSERENRGWSQGHLARVAGLSLRTIQRIEKTRSASFESVTAVRWGATSALCFTEGGGSRVA